MKKSTFKRTAGQRRYLKLKNDVDLKITNARQQLESLQRRMQLADGNAEGPKQLRQMVIMQEITEVIGVLK